MMRSSNSKSTSSSAASGVNLDTSKEAKESKNSMAASLEKSDPKDSNKVKEKASSSRTDTEKRGASFSFMAGDGRHHGISSDKQDGKNRNSEDSDEQQTLIQQLLKRVQSLESERDEYYLDYGQDERDDEFEYVARMQVDSEQQQLSVTCSRSTGDQGQGQGVDHDQGMDNFDTALDSLLSAANKPTSAQASSGEDPLADLLQFFQPETAPGPQISQKLAEIINSGMRAKPNDAALDKLIEKFPIPENCDNLVVPKTNPLIWDKISQPARMHDNSVQKQQRLLIHALIPVIRVVDNLLQSNAGGGKPVSGDILSPLMDTIRMLVSLFMKLCQSRRESIKGNLHAPFTKLCSVDQPVSKDLLFGDEVTKNIKDISEADAIGKKLQGKTGLPSRRGRYPSHAAGGAGVLYRSPLSQLYRARPQPYYRGQQFQRPFLGHPFRRQGQQNYRPSTANARRLPSKDNQKEKK